MEKERVLLLSFFMPFISFAYLISLVMISSQLNKSEKKALLLWSPSWGEVTQVIATEHDVSHRFLIHAFYLIEEFPSIPCLLRVFKMNDLNLSNAFPALTEMIQWWFPYSHSMVNYS